MFGDDVDESEQIVQANSIKDFMSVFHIEPLHSNWTVQCKTCFDLTNQQKEATFKLLEDNMKRIYEQTSWGWDGNDKRKELFSPTSRFVLFVDPNSNAVAAFSMFRFEWDDEEEPEHPVLFCYELQVQSSCQKQGLGKAIMSILQRITSHCKLWKTMLTCFKANENAMQFYKSIGFDVDVNSPSTHGHLNEPYEILSDKPKLR